MPEGYSEPSPSSHQGSALRWPFVAAAFYVGLTLLLLLSVTGLSDFVKPGALATTIANNSEAYCFALIVVAWINYQIRGNPTLLIVVTVAGSLLALALLLLISGLPGRVTTLNEALTAAALAVVYVAVQRPLPSLVPWVISGTLILTASVAVLTADESWVIQQAEAIGFLVLLPITLDVVDRAILEPGVHSPILFRLTWYSFLIAEPVVVSLLGTAVRRGDSSEALILQFLGRVHESFLGMLFIALFFAVLLRRDAESALRSPR